MGFLYIKNLMRTTVISIHVVYLFIEVNEEMIYIAEKGDIYKT